MSAPELLVEIEDDLIDFTLGMEHFRLKDGASHFLAIATWNELPVSFGVELGSAWEEQSFDDGPVVRWGTVTFTRIGAESDEFVRVLDEAYDTESDPAQMVEKAQFTAATMEGDPLHPQDGPVKLRLFCNEDEEDQEYYAEFYLDFDLTKSFVQLREKDPDYRHAILRALTAA